MFRELFNCAFNPFLDKTSNKNIGKVMLFRMAREIAHKHINKGMELMQSCIANISYRFAGRNFHEPPKRWIIIGQSILILCQWAQ